MVLLWALCAVTHSFQMKVKYFNQQVSSIKHVLQWTGSQDLISGTRKGAAWTSDVTRRGLWITSEALIEFTSGSFQMHLWPRTYFTSRFAVKPYVYKTTIHACTYAIQILCILHADTHHLGPIKTQNWKAYVNARLSNEIIGCVKPGQCLVDKEREPVHRKGVVG